MSKSSADNLISKITKALQEEDKAFLKKNAKFINFGLAKYIALEALLAISDPDNSDDIKREKEKIIINLIKYNLLNKDELTDLFNLDQYILHNMQMNLHFSFYLSVGNGIDNQNLKQDLLNIPTNAIFLFKKILKNSCHFLVKNHSNFYQT